MWILEHNDVFHKEHQTAYSIGQYIVPKKYPATKETAGTFTICPKASPAMSWIFIESGGEQMERKLASIQQIQHIEAIEGADRIVKATVLGWSVVVLKDEFQVGDTCIYMEVDSCQ